jgi:2-amino-4-hydroxy-6-hydroxymethyldihydropteridine diphosphokinase
MRTARQVLLLLGGNEHDPLAMLAKAEKMVVERLGSPAAHGRDHWTEPWGFASDSLFLNRCLLVRTDLEPHALLADLHAVEQELGRTRSLGVGYTSRSIDIDILLMEDLVLTEGPLQVPHPRMHLRAFALSPAADLCPGWVHPVLERTVLQLLNDLRANT